VAEDNEINRKVIVRQLHLIGLTAHVAIDGLEALKLWRRGGHALMLTDLHMPEMDGYALALAIRAEEPAGHRMPIIALTANALHDEALRCLAAGMDAYLTKPVSLLQLRGTIETWLGPDRPAAAQGGETTAPDPQPQLESAAADLSVLNALIGDDPGAIADILATFRISSKQSCVDIRNGFDALALPLVADAAHKLKAAARAIGAKRLGHACEALEGLARAGRRAELSALLPTFDHEVEVLDRYLAANTLALK
ncbi:MAG: hypothetical protein JWP52_1466, partial [Rhizobacter sp.]|nr:hypothetical protein [Rhizobacter sp.]